MYFSKNRQEALSILIKQKGGCITRYSVVACNFCYFKKLDCNNLTIEQKYNILINLSEQEIFEYLL